MARYRFHLMNGFAERILAGAAIAVVECETLDDDATLQAVAYQLGAPETAFVEPTSGRARVYTPQYALPSSRHAALAIAAALGERLGAPVNFGAGPIKTWRDGTLWHAHADASKSRAVSLSVDALTGALGLDFGDLTGQNLFVDTGQEQLVVPARTQQAVLKARPKPGPLGLLAHNGNHIAQVVLWHQEGDVTTLRSFASDQLNVFEDFGAGDAAANVAGWKLATGSAAPFSFKIEQGHTIQRVVSRLSVLYVSATANRQIAVGGRFWKVGEGELTL
ncbi:phenazine biosynthesis protein PhzF family [Andreprevotia lacus DSM 23236]|jgi:PhzF family phenazine biosynthesis protein|uniref:Phenazine biosynthesis protein PhzF family n=1 Tax=Andreprevotia lacus DSM 23236 TaxID=1121001 RepID=A0A1W1Y0Q1_9NEIS|nr:PhzF family phenazine biosynthesis protein [Andreprevotia lacus]SMC29712.1 phenazine biosynthesis protein PhzF family [Andreprevotia lacus DSM 23236]